MLISELRLAGLWTGLALLSGCGGAHDTAANSKTLCIDVRTGELAVVQGGAHFPAVHAATGEKSLMPALYCAKCAKWFPAPSVEQLHRQQGQARCPKGGHPLTSEGPWPSELESQR